jgi:plasmid replication initiation protein
LLVDLGTLEIISSINLILKDNKYIKQIKTLGERDRNAFVCRGEKYTTLFELSDNNEPNELS